MQNLNKKVGNKSRKICSVPQCSFYCTKDVSLHNFPSDPKLCQQWKIVLRIAKPISKYMQVCSKHFLLEDFIPGPAKDNSEDNSRRKRHKRLKKGIIPSQNIPLMSHDFIFGIAQRNRESTNSNKIIGEVVEIKVEEDLYSDVETSTSIQNRVNMEKTAESSNS